MCMSHLLLLLLPLRLLSTKRGYDSHKTAIMQHLIASDFLLSYGLVFLAGFCHVYVRTRKL